LRQALAAVLPSVPETDLVRSVLWEGEAGREAWRRWRERVGDPLPAFERLHAGLKGLAPLLHVAVQRNQLEIPPAFGSYLRAAYFREELRGNAYRRILSSVLRALAAAELQPLVLKGEALAATIYDDPKTRHSHGIELLVRRAEAARVAAILPALGFRPTRRRRFAEVGQASSWRHASGLPLELRTRLFGPGLYAVANEALWARSVGLSIEDSAAHALGREHALLHVCASAPMSASRSSLRWAFDAWLLVRRSETFDWRFLLEAVAAARLALPLAVTLRFVAEELAAPVPAEVLRDLAAQAAQSDDLEHEVVVLCALAGAHGAMRRQILATSGWSNRLAVLRPLIAPSPAAVRALQGDLPTRSLPFYYAARPARYVAHLLLRLRPAWATRTLTPRATRPPAGAGSPACPARSTPRGQSPQLGQAAQSPVEHAAMEPERIAPKAHHAIAPAMHEGR
jgi:hypothetical protein